MSAIATPPPVRPPYPIYKITVDRYHRMIQAGILTEQDRVELLEGWIVPKMPRNPRHDGTIQIASRTLLSVVPADHWDIRIQSAITLADSESEPDLAIVRGSGEDYLDHHPGPTEIGVVVEVAESSLSEDRTDKGRIYARAGIPIYWIINLVQEQLEVYTDPDTTVIPPRYRQRQDYLRGQQAPLVLDGQEIAQVAVDELLP